MRSDEELQNMLSRITKRRAQDFESKKLRGITAIWKNKTSHLTFYFSEPFSKEEEEEASILCTEIIAEMPGGYVKEDFLILEYPKPLPEQFLAFEA